MLSMKRERCPGEYQRRVTRYGSKQDFYVVKACCTDKPMQNGWCAVHQHCSELLEQGARFGYPRLQINEGLWIGAGRENWEGYAAVYPIRRREQVQRALLRLESERFNEAPILA